jgi:SsrA-binding protein
MQSHKDNSPDRTLVENRRARARYTIDEVLEVGIELKGSEVKSLRDGKIELNDAFAQIERGELHLINAYVAPYAFATSYGHEPKRPRKLLAHRHEIDKLDARVRTKGYTLIPLKVYLKGGRVKIELGLAKGKAFEDRREEIKEREFKREAQAEMARGHSRKRG